MGGRFAYPVRYLQVIYLLLSVIITTPYIYFPDLGSKRDLLLQLQTS
jgi:hypothetical protein